MVDVVELFHSKSRTHLIDEYFVVNPAFSAADKKDVVLLQTELSKKLGCRIP